MQNPEQLNQACRTRGVKLTPQRLAIFDSLRRHPGHPTAEELYQDVLQHQPTVSFATVYNTLQLLVAMGEVREVIVDELRRRYDRNTEEHAHAVCRLCRRIVDVAPEGARSWDRLPGEVNWGSYDFLAERARVEFTGLCGSCVRGGGGHAPAASTTTRADAGPGGVNENGATEWHQDPRESEARVRR